MKGALRPAILVPVVACAVASLQFTRSHFGTLSPWKGGGFGMFSAISDRILQVELETTEGRHLADLRGLPHLRQRLVEARVLPTPERLAAIVAEARGARWYQGASGGDDLPVARTRLDDRVALAPLVVRSARARVFGLAVAREEGQLARRLIAGFDDDRGTR